MTREQAEEAIAGIMGQLPMSERYAVARNMIEAAETRSTDNERDEFVRRRERWSQMNRRQPGRPDTPA